MQQVFSVFFMLGILVTFESCATIEFGSKIKGVSFVASHDTIVQKHIDPLMEIGADHAAVMPFGFVRGSEDPRVIFNTPRQWYGERYEGAKQYIQALHSNRITVMLKPQLWVGRGVFTGDFKLEDEESWKMFEATYTDFILLYAKLAQEEEVAIFCIGTELYGFIKARPDYWENLITEVRNVYSGQITYAENWDKVKEIPFWESLDFIGVDAYFPVSKAQTPSIAQARIGWHGSKKMLAMLSRKRNKPILFTEYGYRSTDYAGKEPWETSRHDKASNEKGQANLYEALFEEFWEEPWFAGGFVWKWFHDHERATQELNNRFTPQGKLAEGILKKWYRMPL